MNGFHSSIMILFDNMFSGYSISVRNPYVIKNQGINFLNYSSLLEIGRDRNRSVSFGRINNFTTVIRSREE